MTTRRSILDFVSSRLGSRDLIWAGLRSDDIEAISDLPQLAGSFCIVGGRDRAGVVPSLDFEDLAGAREDLDSWDIEDHLGTPLVQEFREAMLRRLADPTALLPYRPSNFLSAVAFARRDSCLDLGLFGGHQAMFEHKPWVETSVAALGLPHVDWVYVADEELPKVQQLLADGPVLLRVSRSSGGAGLILVDDPDSLEESWPRNPEAFVSVSRFLDGAIPINIGATVWRDGVTMQHPSIQLVGIPECTVRPFGYCGNDFGLAAELDRSVVDAIEESVLVLGRWLHSLGYLGTFGVDYLLHKGVPLFSEINPRFQGSTHASSQLSSEANESCIILDHLAAMLGGEAPHGRALVESVRDVQPLAHLVVHWRGEPGSVDAAPLTAALRSSQAFCRVDVEAKPTIATQHGAVVARVTTRQRMTSSGYELAEPWKSILEAWSASASLPGRVVSRR